ncbi:MAG: hypothetical protein L3J98_15170 [Gammaproteobacteria bacterium]|nr:hypothetical protein [Gammaproteobacteria bacterium]
MTGQEILDGTGKTEVTIPPNKPTGKIREITWENTVAATSHAGPRNRPLDLTDKLRLTSSGSNISVIRAWPP